MAAAARRPRAAARDHREFGYAQVTHDGAVPAARRVSPITRRAGPRRARRLDEPRRSRRRSCRRVSSPVGASANAPLAAMADESRRFYGVQFHPEVTHTLQGARDPRALRARHLRLRGALGAGQHHRGRDRARARAGRHATRCCSGSPAASIRPWSRRCCTGRSATSSPACSSTTACCAPSEGDQVMETFARHMGVKVIRVDAEQRFLAALAAWPIPSASARSSAACSSRCSTKRRTSSKACAGSRRARSIPT